MSDTPIRVLMISDHMGYAGGVIHGVSRYFLSIVPHFDPERVRATVCFLRPERSALNEFRAKGLEPIFLSRSKWDPRVVFDLTRLVRKLDIEVLHLSGLKACLLGRVAARLTGRRAVVHHHDTKRLTPLLRFLQRRAAQWTDAALAVSDPVRSIMIEDWGLPPKCVETLYYGIKLEEFAQVAPGARERIRSELNIPEQAAAMAIIGRLSPVKGHELLLSCMPDILQRCPEAVLIVVGDGPTRAECGSIVERLVLCHS